MRGVVPLAALLALTTLLGFTISRAAAQPGFPASFHGAVAVDGEPVPPGTHVRGYIDGLDCTQLGENYRTTIVEAGVAQYAIEVVHESQKAGCGDDGKIVTFTVGGVAARETAEWKPGVTLVNLNVGAGSGPTLPPPTPTATLDPTAIAATATESAHFTPIPGTPPTDEVTPPGSTRAPGSDPTAVPPASSDSESEGSGWIFLGSLLVGILILGVVGGTLLARRRPRNVREP
ncbi:MAG: hypothetical protein R3C29_13785 [Dehalococcoidia bacterium]|nr:hypothetical protein [Dehalococcoidia bacterium]